LRERLREPVQGLLVAGRSTARVTGAIRPQQAAANGATLVDAYTAGAGHVACQLPVIRWVDPAAPASPAAPLHPNLFGMQAMSELLISASR